MCEVCGYAGCVVGCPNAPEPPKVTECSVCHEPIREGDEYMDFDTPICTECLDNLTVTEAFDLCGYVVKTAEREEW